ncbi:MAG: hypothetical protein IJR20_05395 [Muribaculaceae bacterium]|nr:hypothetical protein [Muribaculaceae bacterium]
MKTTRLFFVIAIIAMIIGETACKGTGSKNTSSEDSTKVDTLWNAKVQDTFFDTKFGASKEEVIKNFAKHGFRLDKEYSEKDFLVFYHTPKNRFEFGGMTWENLNVHLANDKFYCIRFYTPTKDKATAISYFKDIAEEVSQKYKLTVIEPEDTTIYGKKRAYCKSGLRAVVSCFRYESVDKEIFYAATLGYMDENLVENVSDEL